MGGLMKTLDPSTVESATGNREVYGERYTKCHRSPHRGTTTPMQVRGGGGGQCAASFSSTAGCTESQEMVQDDYDCSSIIVQQSTAER